MANGHGGKRPGAGRKPKTTETYQLKMREIIEETVTPEDWRKVIAVALAFAKSNDKAARDFLAPWVVGKVPEEVKHTGDSENPVEMRVTIVRSSGNRKINRTA